MHMHSGPFQNIDAAVPVPSGGRIYEAGRIEPAVDITLVLRQVAVTDPVRHPTKGVGVGWVGIVENIGRRRRVSYTDNAGGKMITWYSIPDCASPDDWAHLA